MSSLQGRFGLSTDLTPFICHTVLLIVHLLIFIRSMCPAHFDFIFVMYWTMSVTLVLCLMMALRILSLSSHQAFSFAWLVGLFQVSLLMLLRETIFEIHISLLERHWLRPFFLVSWEDACTFQNTPSCFYSDRNLYCSGFHCYCFSRTFIASHLLYFCPMCYVVCCVNIFHKFSFFLYVS